MSSHVIVQDYGNSMLNRIQAIFAEAIQKAYPEITNFSCTVTETTNSKFGDYQCNAALMLSKILKTLNITETPQDVAQKIIDSIEKTTIIKSYEIAGPGFINVFLNIDYLGSRIATLLSTGIQPPKIISRKAIVDFSSPNIAKEMHVGHLRSTIIGDSICRLLEFVGFDVLRLNHLGDWGTQFGMLIAHLKDKFPNYLVETPSISNLQAFYKESKKRFDSEEDFKARAYECVVKLQSYDEDMVKAWKLICDESRADFSKIYEKLDIKITERGESFYQQRMIDLVKELDAPKCLKLEDGRKLFFAKDFPVPLTIVKSDGGFTYDTSDLAAIKQRIFEEEADWIIYVVDSGQSLHLETVFAAARDLNWYNPDEKRIEHVGFGVVLGEDKKKFKTRSGQTIRLMDLLDEGIKRSEDKLQEKSRHDVLSINELKAAKEAIAYGCIKYADLSHSRLNDYVFSFDRMLLDRGNTAVYLLYAYARIRSIAKGTGIAKETLCKNVSIVELKHSTEIKLAKQILKFDETLLAVLNSLSLHLLCDYVYNLSTTFTEFYSECQVIDKDKDGSIKSINYHRLALCEATANTMDASFKILGIKSVEKI